jgi:hypothetical protein
LGAAAQPRLHGRIAIGEYEYRAMATSAQDMLELELALLRRGLDERLAGASERCTSCHRTPLVGERIYEYPTGERACELCRRRRRSAPAGSHVVHGPEFGHTMRITDTRAAA